MSNAWAKGSTRAWRVLRLEVLTRDGFSCQVQVPAAGWFPEGGASVPCGRPANTAGHITPKVHGGADALANLRAECARHNYADGGRLRHAARTLARAWSW